MRRSERGWRPVSQIAQILDLVEETLDNFQLVGGAANDQLDISASESLRIPSNAKALHLGAHVGTHAPRVDVHGRGAAQENELVLSERRESE